MIAASVRGGIVDCILVLDKNDDPVNWVVSAEGDCEALLKLPCYNDPPKVVSKAANPATFVADIHLPNCRDGAAEAGKIYRLVNG